MVHLADDLIDAKVSCLKQMVDVHAMYGGSVLGVQNVPKQDTDKYGIVTLEKAIAPRIGKMSHIVEKPKPDRLSPPWRWLAGTCCPLPCSTISPRSARAPVGRSS